jgi:hypothetical protein
LSYSKRHIGTGQQPLLMRMSGAAANKAAETMRQVAGLAIKNPPKKTPKTHLKKLTKNVFFFLNFFWNNTNFYLRNRFFMNKYNINYHLFTKKIVRYALNEEYFRKK